MFQFIYLVSRLLLAGHLFMHEVNILPPLSLARFFLTQQLIYKSKIEKHNVSLSILYKMPVEPEAFICQDWRKNILATKGPILFFDQILVFVMLRIKQCLRIRAL